MNSYFPTPSLSNFCCAIELFVTQIESLLQTLSSADSQLDRAPYDRESANSVAKAIDDLGYQRLPDSLPFDDLQVDSIRRLETALTKHPTDPVLLNNLGVLYCNRRFHEKSLKYFRKALEQTTTDATIHENLRIAQIYLSKKDLHVVPTEAEPGDETLGAYFDPHAM